MSRRKGVIGFFVHHRVAGNLVMLVMLLGGVLALSRMNIQFFPTFALDVVSVRVVWSGASGPVRAPGRRPTRPGHLRGGHPGGR